LKPSLADNGPKTDTNISLASGASGARATCAQRHPLWQVGPGYLASGNFRRFPKHSFRRSMASSQA
jgi:hypothetical protein